MDVSIPDSCSASSLFDDAAEVVELTTRLAGLEDTFDRHYFRLFEEAPAGYSEKSRQMYALNQIKTEFGQLWTEIDSVRARVNGLTLKAQIVSAASRILSVEQGIAVH